MVIAKKAAKTAPRERSSPQNGIPELVPYVYRQQKRRKDIDPVIEGATSSTGRAGRHSARSGLS